MHGLNMGPGAWWMLFIWLAIVVSSFWLLAALFPRRRANRGETKNDMEESAVAILQRRYARGELSREEFRAMRRDLERP